MTSKQIYLKIDNLIKEKYKNLKKFCETTNRPYVSVAKTFSKNIFEQKGANLKKTEEILNDLGYELTIQKKRKEMWEVNEKITNYVAEILKVLVKNKVPKKDFETIIEIIRKEYENCGVIQEDTQKEFFQKFLENQEKG